MANTANVSGTQREELTAEPELSVVIPCLDEQKTIADCVRVALSAMREHGIAGEVVVSDNGSKDDSVAVATAAGARVVKCPIVGYGAALQWGFRHARGRYLLMGDADLSYDFSLLPRFMAKARDGFDFVMGARLLGRIEPGAMPLLNRHLGTPVLTWVLNRLFGTGISDCNCGMRLIRRETLFALDVVSPGMEFASEMVVKAAIKGVTIGEIPIDFYRDKRGRRPHLRPWRDGWRHLRLLLWHAPDHMMTLPGLVMLALGLPLVLSQLAGPFHLGGAYFDIHYMILGTTLSLLGTSGASLGIVVGAAMPNGRVRELRFLATAHRWFTFDRAAVISALLVVLGLLMDAIVLAYWLKHDRGSLSFFWTRLTILGLLLMAMGGQLGLSALLLGTTGNAVSTAPVRDLLSGTSTRPPPLEGDAPKEGGA